MAESALISTGIAGLDVILRQGIPRDNVILVEGAAGTGKTLFGLEFIYRGATHYDEPGLIVSFEVSPRKLIRDAASFGWDLEALQQQNRLKLIFSSPQVLNQELLVLDSVLLETAAAMGARRIFIDGIALLRTVPPGERQRQWARPRPLPPALAAVARRAGARAPDGTPVARGHGHRAAGLRPGDHRIPGGHRDPPAPRAAPGGTRRSLENSEEPGPGL
jgi:hypothetical protein